LEDLGWKHFK